MQHVTAEGTALVKQAEDAASNKKVGLLMTILTFANCLIWLLVKFFSLICILLPLPPNKN
jgi:flagellar biogenesis protein FliO